MHMRHNTTAPTQKIDCLICQGTGKFRGRDCSACNGAGKL